MAAHAFDYEVPVSQVCPLLIFTSTTCLSVSMLTFPADSLQFYFSDVGKEGACDGVLAHCLQAVGVVGTLHDDDTLSEFDYWVWLIYFSVV